MNRLAVIRHYESATSGGNEFAQARMAEHQKKFLHKWEPVLKQHYAPGLSQISAARIAVGASGLRILYIDDRIPHRNLGSGYPRSNDILRQLVALGHHVTCSTLMFPLLRDEYSDIPREIELFDGLRNRAALIKDYCRCSDVVWVSRPHNLHVLLTQCLAGASPRNFRLIYDAEAIFSERAQQKRALGGPSADAVEPYDEFALARSADTVVVVSESDRTAMLRSGVRSVHVIGHRLSPPSYVHSVRGARYIPVCRRGARSRQSQCRLNSIFLSRGLAGCAEGDRSNASLLRATVLTRSWAI